MLPHTPLIIFMTVPDRDEARSISRTLLEERLAACCNILGAVESIFWWEGDIEESEEVLVMIKSSAERFPELERRINELHSYDIPEIVAVPIIAGSELYLRWIESSLQSG